MDEPANPTAPTSHSQSDDTSEPVVLTSLSALQNAVVAAQSLPPDERLRLIAMLWSSLPDDHWAAPTRDERDELRARLKLPYSSGLGDVPWQFMNHISAGHVAVSEPSLYSAPRRFDLSTIFAVTTAYSLLFTLLKSLGLPGSAISIVGGYIAVVGVGQALLFGGRKPRRASILVGILACVVGMLAIWLLNPRLYSPLLILGAFVLTVIYGLVTGYIAGTLVGGVFLVADKIRQRFANSGADDAGTPAASSR